MKSSGTRILNLMIGASVVMLLVQLILLKGGKEGVPPVPDVEFRKENTKTNFNKDDFPQSTGESRISTHELVPIQGADAIEAASEEYIEIPSALAIEWLGDGIEWRADGPVLSDRLISAFAISEIESEEIDEGLKRVLMDLQSREKERVVIKEDADGNQYLSLGPEADEVRFVEQRMQQLFLVALSQQRSEAILPLIESARLFDIVQSPTEIFIEENLRENGSGNFSLRVRKQERDETNPFADNGTVISTVDEIDARWRHLFQN